MTFAGVNLETVTDAALETYSYKCLYTSTQAKV